MPLLKTSLLNHLPVVRPLQPTNAVTPRLFVPILLVTSFVVFGGSMPARAQSQNLANPASEAASAASPAPSGSASAAAQPSDDDGALDLAEPDFAVVNIPTTLRLPLHKGSFRLTHRFGGNLRNGTFGEQAADLFGLDRGAVVGFEYRYGIAKHLQAIAYRTAINRTIQLSAKYDAIHQDAAMPVSVSAIASVEGQNNFKEQFAPALAAAVSREIQDRLAVYATPTWVHNSASALGVVRDTMYVGIGGRARVSSTVYVVAEVSPRLVGYISGPAVYGFGVEKRAGGHIFQLTFANTQGTTFGQIVRGGAPESLYLGFNLTRKFF